MKILINSKLYISLITIFISYNLFSQSNNADHCAYEANLQKLEQLYPGTFNNIQSKKEEIQQLLQNNDNLPSNAIAQQQQVIYQIPVVVHVVWNTAIENLPDAQIFSQIDVLNEDFGAANADITGVNALFTSDIANVEFQFCLANIDPNGQATTGITRTETTTTEFSFGTDVMNPADGGIAPWDTDQYMNIYVADIGYGLLGYATPPGGPPNQDGVVVNFNAFGKGPFPVLQPSYNLGRTATHEVGHYFALEHPWGTFGGCSDDDGYADTPTTEMPNVGCPAFGAASTTCGSQDNFYLFMDYCDDECLLMFSNDQKDVMVAALTTQRSGLLNSIATCDTTTTIVDPPVLPNVNIALTANGSNIVCDNVLSPVLTIENLGNTTVTSSEFVYNFNGGTALSQFWNGTLLAGDQIDVTLFSIPVSSDFTLNVEAVNVNNNAEVDLSDNAVSIDYSISLTGTFPLVETFEEIEFEQAGWIVENDLGYSTTGWIRNTTIGAYSDACFVVENQNLPIGSIEYLTTPFLDLYGKTNINLKLDYAYARRTGFNNDAFVINYSLDCGESWIPLHVFTPTELETASQTTLDFVPAANEWKEKILSLDFLNNQSKVIFRFQSISANGNPLYIDNINFNFLDQIPANIDDNNAQSEVSIYPNPVLDGNLNIIYRNVLNPATFQILDLTGKLFQEGNLNQFNTINVKNYEEGYYLVRIISDQSTLVKKIILTN